jgi:hypothetical protein
MPRGPEARGSVDYEKSQGLDTLAGGTPICMYRHVVFTNSEKLLFQSSCRKVEPLWFSFCFLKAAAKLNPFGSACAF